MTAPLARGNEPLLPPAAASPPEGEILAAGNFSILIVNDNGEGKPYNRAFGARKYTPSAYGTSPGGGGLLYAFPCANLSRSLHSGAKTSPSGVAKELDS